MKYIVDQKKKDLYLYRRKMLMDKVLPNVSLITNTCIGGRLYHDYSSKFLSPTIDLYITPSDFVKFCNNLKEYLSYELEPCNDIKIKNFIVAKLKDIHIYFSHTNYNFKVSKENWDRRKERINYDNIIVIATDRCTICESLKPCTKEIIEEFGKIPYKKVIFTTKKYNYDYTSFLYTYKDYVCTPEATLPSPFKPGKYILETDGFDLDKFILNK